MNPMATRDPLKTFARDSFYPGEPLSLVGVCLDDGTWQVLKIFAESTSLINLRFHLGDYRIQEREAVTDYLGEPTPDICLLDFDKDRRSAAVMAERIHASGTGTAIFAVSSQSQPDSILEAMRSGCSEYLVKPIDREQLVSAVARVGARRKEKQDQFKAQVLAFMGAKGGCGTTTIVTQMGALLSETYSRKSLVVDMHPDFGDAALYLKLTNPRYHFFELLENADRLDADFLQSFLMQHSSGLELIAAPEGGSTRDALPVGVLGHTMNFLRARYEFILMDLPPALNEENLTVIRDCEQLYLITVAEVSAIRNVVRQLEYFTRKEIPRDKIRVVVNRHQRKNLVTDSQIEKVIGQKIYWRVPNQYPQVVKTIHEGDPIGQLSNSEVTRNLRDWASAIGRKPGAEEKKRDGGGILGLWNR